ncbi:MAG: methionyl-tRNA formyltransferase [Myxococcota bacterium]
MARIAFFGSPDFACTILNSLHTYSQHAKHQIALVVCQPDRPRGRGQHLHAPAVKTLAQSYNLPIAQPNALKPDTVAGQAFLTFFRRCNIDLAVVASYGRIIPQALLDVPEHGFINVHASLLPRWRGASPIQRALQAGDARTGVSIMRMTFQLDAGDVYSQHELPILPHHDVDSLQQDLALLACQVLPGALQHILTGTLKPIPQPFKGVTYAPLLTKKDGHIHFAQPAQAVVNHTRAMHPWPGVYVQHKTTRLRLCRAQVKSQELSQKCAPGTVVQVTDGLVVATQPGSVLFQHAQLPGKRMLPIRDLCNGYPLHPGDVLVPLHTQS